MITEPSVFVIGAGASAPYGFPVGAALVDRIIDNSRDTSLSLHRGLNLASFAGVQDFQARLARSGSYSIDTFLESNELRFQHIGRATIAYCILEAEARCVAGNMLFGRDPRDHWLRYLWNLIRAGSTPQTMSDNHVTFVTYNYDRVVETYLACVIENAFNVSPAEAAALQRSHLPVIHLHGQIPDTSFGEFRDDFIAGELGRLSSGIRVIHDSDVGTDTAFAAAQQALSQAQLICFLGFGYHPVNLKRLAVHHHAPAQARIFGSTYGMGPAEIESVPRHLGRRIIPGNSAVQCERFLRDTVPLV